MDIEIFGDRLRQARVLRQRKATDLAGLLDCSVPTMSKWERARTVQISSHRLSTLVNELRFSPAFFSARPSPPLFDNDLLFKAPKSTPKREIDWLREFVRLTSELLDWLDERRQLPPVNLELVSNVGPDIRNAARGLRNRLNLAPAEPIKYLTHPVERAGIVVVVRRHNYIGGGVNDGSTVGYFNDEGSADSAIPSRERHEGCSAWVGEFRERPLIIMRGVPTWEKTRWVLAHELGHLSLHAGRTFVSQESEEEASAFASELLAPIDEITKDLPSVVTLGTLLELKLKWGISLAALIRHLHFSGVITDQRKKTLYDQLYTRRNPETGRSFGATEPGWDRSEPERPRLITAWLEHIAGNVNPEVVASMSGILPADLLGSILSEQRKSPKELQRSGIKRRRSNDQSVVYLQDRLAERIYKEEEDAERQSTLLALNGFHPDA